VLRRQRHKSRHRRKHNWRNRGIGKQTLIDSFLVEPWVQSQALLQMLLVDFL
jgi:hypothetical protein